jgi:hypothetical protein
MEPVIVPRRVDSGGGRADNEGDRRERSCPRAGAADTQRTVGTPMQQDPSDFEIVKARDVDRDAEDSGGSRRWGAIALALLVALVAGGYFLWWRTAEEPSPAALQTTGEADQEAAGPLGGEPMPGNVPPLEESDAFVRELLRHLSSHPRVAAWLATDGLIRNFTVVVTNIADGRTPAPHVPVLKPAGDFSPAGTGADLQMDPRSYARYDQLADAVDSVNVAGTAEIYATLKPRIEEAHRELGGAESFDRTLERALIQLLATPVPEGPVRLRPAGIGYAFADPRLESLTGAQKQLLRMGPRNVRLVKDALRDVALELGIPASRLPPPP